VAEDPNVKLRVAGELGRFLVSERLEHGVDFASSADLPLDHAEVVPLSYLTPSGDVSIVPIVVNAFADAEPQPLRPCRGFRSRSHRVAARAEAGGGDRHWGLSHWVGLPETDKVNADFDRWFLDCLVAGKREEVITNWLWHRSDNVGRSVKGVFDKDLAPEPPARAQWCRYRIPTAGRE
jgi:hypothetical protein